MEANFKEKVIFISGAASGFGRLAAKKFANLGAQLALTDINGDALLNLAKDLEQKGHSLITHIGDIADPECSKETIKTTIKAFGKLDIAINNAGIAHQPAKFTQIDPIEAKRNVDVNLMGTYYAMREQILCMEKQFAEDGLNGIILNIASVAGLVGAPTLSLYAAAKHAIVGMSKSTAVEYARHGIRINVLCPSFAETPMVTQGLLHEADDQKVAQERLVRGIPMRRMASAEEVVNAMVFICHPNNSFMTGQAIALDGGLTAY